jgi:AcrR family transcriptional regulator
MARTSTPSPQRPAISLRETNKNKRREDIISAAERLIYRTQSTDFSMHDLADEAGVSMKTTYNLIGSKSKVLYVLLSGALEKIDGHPMSRPKPGEVMSVIDMAEVPIGLFTGLPGFYRPLLRYLLGTPNSTERPEFMARAYEFWHRGLVDFAEDYGGRFRTSAMALHLHTYFAGALDLWVQDEIDAEEFRRHLRCAVAMALLPFVEEPQVPVLQAHIDLFQTTAISYEVLVARYAAGGPVELS